MATHLDRYLEWISALYVVASLHHRRRVRAGAIVAIDGMAIEFDATQYNPHRDEVRAAIERECDVAVAATRRLIARDRAAGRQGLRTEDRGPRAEA